MNYRELLESGCIDLVEASTNMEDSPENDAELLKRVETNFYPELDFDFLEEQRGPKKGMLHLLLGTTGSGKTTLARSLMLKLSNNHRRVCWYSSEEQKDAFQYGLIKANVKNRKNIFLIQEHLVEKDAIDEIRDTCLKNKLEFLFYDNVTTSKYYTNLGQNDASEFVKRLEGLAKELNIPFFIIAHTHKDVRNDSEKMPDANDVRGFKDIAMRSHYIYSFLMINYSGYSNVASFMVVEDKQQAIIGVTKARFLKGGKFFSLDYSKVRNLYTSDEKMTSKDFLQFVKTCKDTLRAKKKDEGEK